MTLDYTVRPISDRTEFTGRGKSSPFKATWTATLHILERELRHLGASRIVIEVDVPEGHIGVQGQLLARARATSTAVRVAFDSKHGPLAYATDEFGYDYAGRMTMTGWQDNVRAIALGMEALRKVERYGIARRAQQYRGYKAIGGGIAPDAPMTRAQAVVLLRDLAPASSSLPHALRTARKAHHPDVGGDPRMWAQIDKAAQILNLT